MGGGIVDGVGMEYIVDYLRNGTYGVFAGEPVSKLLMTSTEASECMEWAKKRAGNKPVLYPAYIKEIIVIELTAQPLAE